MNKKETLIKNTTLYATYLLLIWGFYRLLFKLPDEVEEIFVKPLIWLLPIFYLIRIERLKLSDLGITFKNIFPSIYLPLGLGSFFILEAMIANFIKYKGFNFAANIGEKAMLASLALSFATAVSEEVSFRGFIFARAEKSIGKFWPAAIITTIVWTLIHVPVTVFVWKFNLQEIAVYLFITSLFGIGSSFVYSKTKNIISSILLHVFWEWPIILFR